MCNSERGQEVAISAIVKFVELLEHFIFCGRLLETEKLCDLGFIKSLALTSILFLRYHFLFVKGSWFLKYILTSIFIYKSVFFRISYIH